MRTGHKDNNEGRGVLLFYQVDKGTLFQIEWPEIYR